MSTRPIKFSTLGPVGSNHEFVVTRYIDFHGLGQHAQICLHSNFDQAVQSVFAGETDFIVQCAVHPATPEVVAQYYRGLFVIDTFICSSHDLALVRRADCIAPKTVGAMSATAAYTDLARWGQLITTDTVAAVAEGLLQGRLDAGLTFPALARDHPGRFCIDQHVESVDDAWLVYGRDRVSKGLLVACADSAAAKIFSSAAASKTSS